MFTRRGRVLLVEALLLYVLARGLSVGELHGLALAALVFPVLALVLVRWSRHRIGFTRTLTPRRLFAGGTVTLTYEVRNLGRVPTPPLVLDDGAPPGIGGSVRVALPSLAPGRSGTIAVERTVSSRGTYRLGPLRARLIDPFGLAEIASEVGPRVSVVVYPRIDVLRESSMPRTRGGGSGAVAHRLAVAGDEFYAVRDWQHGDDLRKVHWRSTARRGSLQMRQDEVPPFPRSTVLVDTRDTVRMGAPTDPALEWAVSAAASVLWELGRQGFALRLVTPEGEPVPARWGREAIDPLLTVLADAGGARAATIAPSIRRAGLSPGAGGIMVAVLPPPDQESLRALVRLRRAYAWCGAVLVDAASFSQAAPRERAEYDQRLADADRALARGGWRVAVAGSTDRFPTIWQTLLGAVPSRPSSPSRRSS